MKKIITTTIALTLLLSSCGYKQSSNDKIKPNDEPNISIKDKNSNTNQANDNSNINSDKIVDNTDNTDVEKNGTDQNNDNTNPSQESNNNNEQTINPESLSNKEIDFGPPPVRDHKSQYMATATVELFKKFDAYYVGDINKKEIYLTFDEGYENGYTSKILDVLKEQNVKAAFFVTRPYIMQNKELIKRMVDEGHIVANHSSTHPSMPQKAVDFEKFKKEFEDTEAVFKEITGQDMPKFFRPPMGKYSEKSLYYTQKLGYKTIFWSFAHKDWIVDDQPPVETTIQKVLDRSHNGEIMLLHAVSKSNTEALPTIIKTLREQGFEFKPLTELP